MNKILALFALLLSLSAFGAGPQPCFYSGTVTKCYPSAGIDLSTTGQSLKLPNNAATGSSGVNLDYYSYNAWTPTVAMASGTPGTWTSPISYFYTVIGDRVCMQGFQSSGTTGGTVTGIAVSLPLAPYTGARQFVEVPCIVSQATNGIGMCKLDTSVSTTSFLLYKDFNETGFTAATTTTFSFDFCYRRS